MSLGSASRMEKWLFSSDSKQVQIIELRRRKAETLSIGLVFSWKLTRSCVTQSSQDETEDWSLSTSLPGTLHFQAPSTQYVPGSINNGSMLQYCSVFWRISTASVWNNESPDWSVLLFPDGQRSRGGRKTAKKIELFNILSSFFTATIQFRRYTNVFVDILLLEIFPLNSDVGSFQQDNHANAGFLRTRALSWHFNGVINPCGQVPVRVTPVWYLH